MSHYAGMSPPPVPEGWVAKFDEQYKEWYYVNLATGQSQWESPIAARPPAGPPPSSVPHQSTTVTTTTTRAVPTQPVAAAAPPVVIYNTAPQQQYPQQQYHQPPPQQVYTQRTYVEPVSRSSRSSGPSVMGVGAGFVGGMLVGKALGGRSGRHGPGGGGHGRRRSPSPPRHRR